MNLSLNLSQHDLSLIDRGLARVYRGRLIPVMRGGDGTDDPDEALYPTLPADADERAAHLSDLSLDELTALEAELAGTIRDVGADPASFAGDERSFADLVAETRAATEMLRDVRAEIEGRDPAPTDAELAAELASLADDALAVDPEPVALAADDEPAVDPEPDPAPDPEPAVDPEPEPVIAAAPAAVAPSPAVRPPSRSRLSAPTPAVPAVSLTAAAGDLGHDLGSRIGDLRDVGAMMLKRRRQFGSSPSGNDRYPIVKADWADLYPAERQLGGDGIRNMALIAAATDPTLIRAEMDRRKKSLVAAGGWCALSTPFYNLQVISTTSRPVRDSLPGFLADRGGIRAPRPAGLSSITTGVGHVTAADDAEGGTFATKTCQVIDCPDFEETLADALFHCLQFGNMGARAFPELVAQWNELVMAAQARQAESFLLTGIDTASTQVTASDLGLGATAALLPQILAAANGMRNRNRMDRNAVLRLMIPAWAVALLVSDVIRGQFQRFDTDEARVTALLRSFNVEPTFYIDGGAGRGQVFGSQGNTDLLPFPATVVWYLFPEGSFLYLDGGSLELGIVRDSILNAQNDFQIFGESFENVAFVGIESLAVESTTCDSGTVSLPDAVACPIDYA